MLPVHTKNLLRSEANTLKNNANVSNVSLKFNFKSGKELVINLADKTFYEKPTIVTLNDSELEVLKVVWITKSSSSDNNVIYSITQPTRTEYIDPAELNGFTFVYDVTIQTNVTVNNNNE